MLFSDDLQLQLCYPSQTKLESELYVITQQGESPMTQWPGITHRGEWQVCEIQMSFAVLGPSGSHCCWCVQLCTCAVVLARCAHDPSNQSSSSLALSSSRHFRARCACALELMYRCGRKWEQVIRARTCCCHLGVCHPTAQLCVALKASLTVVKVLKH
jgi:hypothetical protein